MRDDDPPTGEARLVLGLSEDIEACLDFCAEQAGRVPQSSGAFRWLVAGLSLLLQNVCLAALAVDDRPASRARRSADSADEEGRILTAPELLVRVSDPRILRPPFTLPLEAEDRAAVIRLTHIRNRIFHPRSGATFAIGPLARDCLAICRLIRFLHVTQPASRQASAAAARCHAEQRIASIEAALEDCLFLLPADNEIETDTP
jgi:hypothetical protein